MRYLLSKAKLRTEPHNFPDHRNNYFWSKLSQYFDLVKDFRKKCILRRLRVRIPKKLSPFQSKCPLTKKKKFFFRLQIGNSNDVVSTWIDEKSGTHFREHADTSASTKCAKSSARMCFAVTNKSRIREYEDRTYHFLVLSTLVWWAPILALRSL